MTTVNLTANRDTFIRADAPNNNYDGTDVAVSKGTIIRSALIGFDLSSIPISGYIYPSVKLKIYVYGVQNTNSVTVSAYRIIRDWVVGYATYNKATSVVNWGTPGCNNTTTDRSGTSAGNVAITTAGAWYEININSNEFKSMLSNNDGFILIATGGADDSYKQIESLNYGTRPPVLTVEYEIAPPSGAQDAQAVWFV